MNETSGPLRMSWRFELGASLVQKAAQAKREWHEERLSKWREAEKETEEALRTKGIDFRSTPRPDGNIKGRAFQAALGAFGAMDPLEGAVQATHYQNEPTFDNNLWKDLQDAQGKVREHLARAREFQSWENALKLLGDKTISLTFQDVEYFDLYAVAAKVAVPA